MTSSAAGRWLLLAALWSLQYIFMRIAVPVFGTGIVAESRALFAAALLAPAWAELPPPSTWTPGATAALIALGALVSGLAYLPFFTLVRDIGPTRTLTVGLAVPVLGIFWGWLILGETITASMLAGAALVLAALVMVMKH